MNSEKIRALRSCLLRGAGMTLIGGALAFGGSAYAQNAAPDHAVAGQVNTPASGQVTAPSAPTDAQPVAGPADQPLGAPAATKADETTDVVVTGSRIRRDGFGASTPVNVLSAQEVTLSGTTNVEQLLTEQPQFVASANGSRTGNAVPAGTAQVNLRGFGSQRNLVLVNGRRFAIFGPEQITDLNTIPSALIARTEVVTGGSSAVYGSDAITGVTNFIIRDDFHGVEGRYQLGFDAPTTTPTHSVDLTVGTNFADGRGNIAISGNYFDRGGITRAQRGGYAALPFGEGCIVPGSGTQERVGTPLAGATVSNCVARGGQLGFVNSGSGDIPTGRFTGVPTVSASNPASLNAALIAAGLGNMGSFGFTFNGQTARPAIDPDDRYNLIADNYLVIPEKRRMVNAFSHYKFSDAATAYLEVHYSDIDVDAQLAPSNLSATTLFNVNNPYISPALQSVFQQLDARETGTTTVVAGPATFINRPNDGLVAITAGRRYVEVGDREADDNRKTFRTAIGVRGNIGDVSSGFLRDLNYDVYYSYANSKETLNLDGAISRSAIQQSVLSVNGAAPVCDIFGANITSACADALRVKATNRTDATLQVAAGNISGTLFQLPAGAFGFSTGVEWRKSDATYSPDVPLSSGDVAGFNPGLPTSGSVTVKELYGEIRVPLIHDTPFIRSLVANAAFRLSDYNLKNVGTVWTYLGGLEWEVAPALRLRGQYQRAIRAPSVAELFGGRQRQVGTATDPCSSRAAAAQQTDAVRALCIATGVPAAAVFSAGLQPDSILPYDQGGNPDLKEEVSDTVTGGVILSPSFLHNVTVSVDYFNIKLAGAIGQRGGGDQNTLNLCYYTIQDPNSDYCKAIPRDPASGQINTQYATQVLNANTGSLKTSGLDFSAAYLLNLGFGLFGNSSTLSLTSNWTWTFHQTATPVAALPNVQNDCVGAFSGVCGDPFAAWRGNTRITWDSGPLTISLRHRFIDSVVIDRYIIAQRQGTPNPPSLDSIPYPILPAQNYFDLSFTATVMKKLEIFGGVNNLLGKNPPGSVNIYPATYDPLGQEFFIGVKVKF